VPVLIRGESGTGKELVARAIRRLSGRRARGDQAINCADFTPELLRSELFGHERGAFTGAVGKTEGLLPRVDGGTVFLDEIGELPPLAQSMLLRFLQSGEGLAVGATSSMRVDVRVIAATHRDLEAAEGAFREDFYYRLWGAVLEVPALRARREDIPLLVEHFRLQCNREDHLAVEGFARKALVLGRGAAGEVDGRHLLARDAEPAEGGRVAERWAPVDYRRAPAAGRNRGSVISGVTSSKTTSTGMRASIPCGSQPTMFVAIRTPSASSTSATTYGTSAA